jgi:hypothetical protein
MFNRKYIILLACLILVIASAFGCKSMNANTKKSTLASTSFAMGDLVTDTLQFQSMSIESIKIIQMKDGKTIIVDEPGQIDNIMVRLSQMKIEKDLGTKGIYLDGYALEFQIKVDSDLQEIVTQFDSDVYLYGFLSDRHFYVLSDSGVEPINEYFEQEKYR